MQQIGHHKTARLRTPTEHLGWRSLCDRALNVLSFDTRVIEMRDSVTTVSERVNEVEEEVDTERNVTGIQHNTHDSHARLFVKFEFVVWRRA